MNFEYFLYQYLLKHQSAEVPDFGVFSLMRESAKIDAENSVIIPPRESIHFEYNPELRSETLAQSIASQTGNDLSTARNQIEIEVRRWLDQLKTENHMELSDIGKFQLDADQNVIKVSDDSDIFGFEAVNLNQLKNRKIKGKPDAEYSFSKSVIWTFLSIIVIGGVIFYFLGDHELLFGKSSNIPTKKVAKKVSRPKAVAAPIQDSIKTDSTKSTNNAKIQKTGR